MNQLSASRIDVAKCMYRYKKRYIDKDIDFTSDAMRVGGLIHKIVHDYTKECVRQKVEADYEIMKDIIYNGFDVTKLSMEYYPDVSEVCLGFGENPIDYDHVLDYEKRFNFNLSGDVEVQVVLDRTDADYYEGQGLIKILDYKTQRNIDSSEKLQDDFQMKLYRFGALKYQYDGFSYVRTGIYYLRYNFIKWIEEAPVYVGDLRNQFDALEEYLKLEWDRIFVKEDYTPERGKHCWEYGGCPVLLANKCPLWDLKEIERMREAKDLKNKIRLVRKLTHELKYSIDYVKQLIPDEGLEIDGEFVGNKSTEYYQYNYFNFEAWCWANSFGRTELESIKLSAKEVEKIVKLHERNRKPLSEEAKTELEDIKIKNMRRQFKY